MCIWQGRIFYHGKKCILKIQYREKRMEPDIVAEAKVSLGHEG